MLLKSRVSKILVGFDLPIAARNTPHTKPYSDTFKFKAEISATIVFSSNTC